MRKLGSPLEYEGPFLEHHVSLLHLVAKNARMPECYRGLTKPLNHQLGTDLG